MAASSGAAAMASATRFKSARLGITACSSQQRDWRCKGLAMTDQTSFDTATRIAAGDDGTSYNRVAIALHWTTALLVLVQFVTSFVWDWFPRQTRQMLES